MRPKRPCPPWNELAKICTGALYQISNIKKHVSDWRRSGFTASAPVSGVSAPACTNGVWPLRPVSAAQKNKPSTMLSSNAHSIDFRMVGTAWWFWTMRQLNGCSTPAPKSIAANSGVKDWLKKRSDWQRHWLASAEQKSWLHYCLTTDLCALFCSASSLKKIVHNDRCFKRRNVFQSDLALQEFFVFFEHDMLRIKLPILRLNYR